MGQHTKTPFRRSVLAAAISNALIVSAASAATITVDSLLDDNGTGCTLREAIVSANGDNAAGNGCVDGVGDDTIVFDGGLALPGTITLDNTIFVTSSLSIQGPGADQLTIDANNLAQHFWVSDNEPNDLQTVAISHLTLVNAPNISIVSYENVSLNHAAEAFVW